MTIADAWCDASLPVYNVGGRYSVVVKSFRFDDAALAL